MNQEYLEKLEKYIRESEGIIAPPERISLRLYYQLIQEKPETAENATGIVRKLQRALVFYPEGSRGAELLKQGISLLEKSTTRELRK